MFRNLHTVSYMGLASLLFGLQSYFQGGEHDKTTLGIEITPM